MKTTEEIIYDSIKYLDATSIEWFKGDEAKDKWISLKKHNKAIQDLKATHIKDMSIERKRIIKLIEKIKSNRGSQKYSRIIKTIEEK